MRLNRLLGGYFDIILAFQMADQIVSLTQESSMIFILICILRKGRLHCTGTHL